MVSESKWKSSVEEFGLSMDVDVYYTYANQSCGNQNIINLP